MKHITKQQQLEMAVETFKASLQSPFYAKKYAGVKCPTTWEEWQKLPPLTRDELYQNTYPSTTNMLTRPVKGGIVSSTGGSSGIARTIVLSYDEWDEFCQRQAEAMMLVGVDDTDIVANLYIAGKMWPSFLGGHEIIKRTGAMELPISANMPPEEIYQFVKRFQPTVLISLPTLFVLMADMAKAEGYVFPNLKLCAYVGEQMSREADKYVRQYLGAKDIQPLAYTSGDCGLMGYPCENAAFGTYHLPTDFQLIEIVDPDTLQPLPDGETGEVLVTSLCRRYQPIIRYRLGDMASFLKESCPCGDPNPLFRLSGRAGEDFKLGGAYISMDVFEKAVSHYSDLSLNYQLTLEDISNQMTINLDVESSLQPDSCKAKEVAEALKQELTDTIRELKVGQEMNFIREFTVKVVALGALPRNTTSGKIKKLIDKRVL